METLPYGPLTRYAKLRVAHALGMPGRFSPPPLVSDPGMHRGTCVTRVPWCMPGSLTSGFLWNRWRGKRSHNPCACATSDFAYLVKGSLRETAYCYAKSLCGDLWCFCLMVVQTLIIIEVLPGDLRRQDAEITWLLWIFVLSLAQLI